MAAGWPSSLPQYFLVQRYEHKPPDNTVRTQTLSGRVKARRRSFKKHRATSALFQMDATQLATFESFWTTTIKDGSEPFQNLNDPVGGANRVWRPANDYSVTGLGGGYFEVSLDLIRLPDTPV